MDEWPPVSSVRKDAKLSSSLITVQRFFPTDSLTQQDINEKLHLLRSVRHKNLDMALDLFYNIDLHDIECEFEYLPVKIVDLSVRALPFLKQLNLAAILGQASFTLIRAVIISDHSRCLKVYSFLKMPG